VRGNPHAAFDEAGAGNVAWSRWCDTRKRKSELTGNTNFDLNRRASPRPYRRAGRPKAFPTPIGMGTTSLARTFIWFEFWKRWPRARNLMVGYLPSDCY